MWVFGHEWAWDMFLSDASFSEFGLHWVCVWKQIKNANKLHPTAAEITHTLKILSIIYHRLFCALPFITNSTSQPFVQITSCRIFDYLIFKKLYALTNLPILFLIDIFLFINCVSVFLIKCCCCCTGYSLASLILKDFPIQREFYLKNVIQRNV